MRFLRSFLLVLVAVLALLACAEPEREAIEVAFNGADAHRLSGRWYTSDGVLQLEIRTTAERASATLFQPSNALYRPKEVLATTEGLLVKITTPDGPREILLRQIFFKPNADVDTGGAEMVMGGNNWFLFKDPSSLWLLRGRIDAKTRPAAEAVGGVIDAFSSD